MVEKMKIRKAKKEDARRISLLKRKTIREINIKDYSEQSISIMLEKNSLQNILNRIDNKNVFCGFVNDVLVGTIALSGNNIQSLAVKYSQVGKGYGETLVEFIENYARRKGVIKLIIYPSLTAREFYKKLGYNRTGKTSTWKFGDKILESSVPIMEKKL
ncbi:MAG: GNAT family N-acetyltransferase [Nanoarchaeota archaeon]|jgi:N-acetylglutamate synthase-like GNAT family acetyltransferase|nr:GNAT family N-acetyltransferase [Nanoarchaeota archaeon]